LEKLEVITDRAHLAVVVPVEVLVEEQQLCDLGMVLLPCLLEEVVVEKPLPSKVEEVVTYLASKVDPTENTILVCDCQAEV
jgi:hypothetical protein